MRVLLIEPVPPRAEWPRGMFRSRWVPQGVAFLGRALLRRRPRGARPLHGGARDQGGRRPRRGGRRPAPRPGGVPAGHGRPLPGDAGRARRRQEIARMAKESVRRADARRRRRAAPLGAAGAHDQGLRGLRRRRRRRRRGGHRGAGGARPRPGRGGPRLPAGRRAGPHARARAGARPGPPRRAGLRAVRHGLLHRAQPLADPLAEAAGDEHPHLPRLHQPLPLLRAATWSPAWACASTPSTTSWTQMRHAVDEFGVEAIRFEDDTLGADRERLLETVRGHPPRRTCTGASSGTAACAWTRPSRSCWPR